MADFPPRQHSQYQNTVRLPEHLLPQADGFQRSFEGSPDRSAQQPNAPPGRHPFHQRAYADPQKQQPQYGAPPPPQPSHQGQHFANSGAPYNQPVEQNQRPQFTGQPQPYSGARHQESQFHDARAQPYPIQESPQVNQRPLPYPVGSDIDELLELTSPPSAPSSVPNFLPQSRRSHRKAPMGMPPIQTSNISTIGGGPASADGGRRIVSTPLYGYGQHSPQTAQHISANDRTRSLTSESSRHQRMQKNMPTGPQQWQSQGQLAMQQKQGYNHMSQSHKPSSSSSGSSSSGHSFSLTSKSRSFTSLSKLSSLSGKKYNSSASLNGNKTLDRNASSTTLNSQRTVSMPGPPKQVVYPAFLSRVAKVFKDSIILTINTKDGLEYHDSFTGKMAVDILCKIIRTNDRNLALLLGRSLDAQKFFRDVTYNHRLRDSVHEVYAFNHIYTGVDLYPDYNSNNNSKHGSFAEKNHLQPLTSHQQLIQQNVLQQQLPSHTSNGVVPLPSTPPAMIPADANSASYMNESTTAATGVNGVFTILTDCYSPTCTRNKLCYSIACPRRLEQQARLHMKPQGGLARAVSRLSLHDHEEQKTLWHETVPQSVLDGLDKHEKMRQELIYEFIYTERDYVKDLEFMTDFYIMPLRNPTNNIIPERERDAFIMTVFGMIGELLKLAKSISEALTRRQQQQKPVIETFADVFIEYIPHFDPFIKYSGNKVFASFEHERQQQVNLKYARFLEAIEKKPESRKQDLSSFLMKGVQRPARYQLLLKGILDNTKETSPDYKYLQKAKEEVEKVLVKMNVQTGESTDRHKIMVLHRLLGKQTLEERFNFKLSYSRRIIYQVTLSRKRDNEKIDLYLFENALLLVKHKIQNKREQHKVYEKPIYLPLLFVNSGYEAPTPRTILPHRLDGSIVSDTGLKAAKVENNFINSSSNSNIKFQINFLGLGKNQVHASLFADDITNQTQVLLQIQQQQRKLIEQHDIFSLTKFETRRFHGNNRINCAVPCYGGKKMLYGTDSGIWVATVRSINATSNEKICSEPTMVIKKLYVTQIEVLVEFSRLLVVSDKVLYEFDLACTDSLDCEKNTKSGKWILDHVSFFKTGICNGKLLVASAKTGNTNGISIFEPSNPFNARNRNRNRNYDIRDISFTSEPVSISFLKTKLCVGCTKGFEVISLEEGKKEPILDEADPSLDFATQREMVTPLAIHRLNKEFLLSYSEFCFKVLQNGWRTNHEWGIFWEGNPQHIVMFYPYLLAFEPGFIEVRDLETTHLIRALVGENIRFLHSNEHEALYACEENGYDIIVSIDFLNLKPRKKVEKAK